MYLNRMPNHCFRLVVLNFSFRWGLVGLFALWIFSGCVHDESIDVDSCARTNVKFKSQIGYDRFSHESLVSMIDSLLSCDLGYDGLFPSEYYEDISILGGYYEKIRSILKVVVAGSPSIINRLRCLLM